jgi:hypothetical protein
MSEGYTKLFSSIVASTIWREPNHVRILWVTMLAMSDRDGVVSASIPGLADLARITVSECEAALATLQEPDPYSRTKDHDGRRIAEIDGGWLILNRAKYRERMSADDRREYLKDYMRTYRKKHASVNTSVNNCKQQLTQLTQTETEKETEKRENPPTPLAGGGSLARSRWPEILQDDRFETAWTEWTAYRKQARKTLTAIGAERQLKALAKYGLEGALLSIDQSIRNGWTGLFEPREGDVVKCAAPAHQRKPSPAEAWNRTYQHIIEESRRLPDHELDGWMATLWDKYKDTPKWDGKHVVTAARNVIADNREFQRKRRAQA